MKQPRECGCFLDGMRKKGVCAEAALRNNDAYRALDAIGNLIKTGATGTNVNDLTVMLVE